MGQRATTLDQQIELLRGRGMTISDEIKAKEVLLDVGYYRLGFYWFPFEETVANNAPRTHGFVGDVDFDDVVKLYYFDYALRNMLLKYITRIEVNFRTYLVYTISNEFKDCPTWFVNPAIVGKNYIRNFDKEVYTPNFKRNKVIARHHRIHINDRYAPAWKTLEFMTLGSIIALYKSLNDVELKKTISRHFGITYTNVFENHMDVVRCVRNTCAHGGVLYDIALHPLIRRGPAGIKGYEDRKLYGALKVIRYLLGKVSENRAYDFDRELKELVEKYVITEELKEIVMQISGFPL